MWGRGRGQGGRQSHKTEKEWVRLFYYHRGRVSHRFQALSVFVWNLQCFNSKVYLGEAELEIAVEGSYKPVDSRLYLMDTSPPLPSIPSAMVY